MVKSKTTDKMKTGQRVVCIKDGWWDLDTGEPAKFGPKKGTCYTIGGMKESSGLILLLFTELGEDDWYNAKGFTPLDENWTEEVITKALKKQLTEPVNNGLHFSQIIG